MWHRIFHLINERQTEKARKLYQRRYYVEMKARLIFFDLTVNVDKLLQRAKDNHWNMLNIWDSIHFYTDFILYPIYKSNSFSSLYKLDLLWLILLLLPDFQICRILSRKNKKTKKEKKTGKISTNWAKLAFAASLFLIKIFPSSSWFYLSNLPLSFLYSMLSVRICLYILH